MKNERNFHIFYQLCLIKNDELHSKYYNLINCLINIGFFIITFIEKLGIQNIQRFSYLNKSGCFNVDGINDTSDFQDVVNAMNTVNISEENQFNIFKIIAGILHLGNISFISNGNYAQTEQDLCIN
jgi:myosin heavy subunit